MQTMDKLTFKDIPQFPHSMYQTTIDLDYLESQLEHWKDRPLILNPEWQRGHVWTVDQQISFMEYFLIGGRSGINIYFNCSTWMDDFSTPIYCVDGLQRITAALDFINDKFKVFGQYCSEYGNLRMVRNSFTFHMLCIKSKRELLKVYVDHNSGGTPHNPEEIKRVQKMIDNTEESDML